MHNFFQKTGRMEASLKFKKATTENVRVMCFAVFLDVLTLDPRNVQLNEKVVREFHI